MEISIKSETDSRLIVYPLIKCLYNYGTIAVYTSNRMLSRLIENELEGGFKNVRIVVSPEADLDAAKESDEYFVGKYDFIIYDNMGAVDYDILIVPVTNRISESFMTDLIYVASDKKTHIIKFGSPAPAVKKEKPTKKPPKKSNESSDETNEGMDETSDEDFNKWDVEKTDEEILQDMLSSRDSKWCKFPTFDAIEAMEARHYFTTPDDSIIREIFRLFGEHLSVDLRQFTKGARLKDESSSDISGTDVR